MKRPFAAALAALALGALAGRSTAAPSYHAILTGQDALVPTGVPWNLRFKLERDNYSRTDLRYQKIEFWANGSLLGTAATGKDGYASLSFATPSSPGDLVVTGKLAQGSSYTASDSTLLVCVRDKATRILVTDVDGTISAASWTNVTKKTNDQLYPLTGSVKALTDIAKDATIVYLTAREDDYRAKTRDWLDRWSFPRGPVFCSDSDHDPSNAQYYKSNVLHALVPYFTNVAAGIGNKDTDFYAYAQNGVRSAMFDTQTTQFPSYAFVTHGWDDLRAANAQGQVPFLAWATSFR